MSLKVILGKTNGTWLEGRFGRECGQPFYRHPPTGHSVSRHTTLSGQIFDKNWTVKHDVNVQNVANLQNMVWIIEKSSEEIRPAKYLKCCQVWYKVNCFYQQHQPRIEILDQENPNQFHVVCLKARQREHSWSFLKVKNPLNSHFTSPSTGWGLFSVCSIYTSTKSTAWFEWWFNQAEGWDFISTKDILAS